MQIHQREPRTTLDIDLAVHDMATLPERALLADAVSLVENQPELVAGLSAAERSDLDRA